MPSPFQMKFFPHERLYQEPWYPWPVWALGWVSIIRAIAWIFSERGLYATTPFPSVLPVKYILFLVLLLTISKGIFGFRTWARNALLVISLLDLFFYLLIPAFTPSTARGMSGFIFEYASGPFGDLLTLILLGMAWRHFGRDDD